MSMLGSELRAWARTERVKRLWSIEGKTGIEGARELKAKPESRAKPDLEQGRVLGEPLPRNFLKIRTWKPCNLVYYLKSNFSQWWKISQPIQLCVFQRVEDSTVGSVKMLQLPMNSVHLKRMHHICVAFQKNVRDGSNINHNSGLYTTRISEEGFNFHSFITNISLCKLIDTANAQK